MTAAREVAEANRRFLAEATAKLEQREKANAAKAAELAQREAALAAREEKLRKAMEAF
jgi:hypothetical protein